VTTDIARLLAGCAQGHSLPAALYADHAVFTLDARMLQNRWSLAGHTSDLPSPGDHLVADLAGESAIVLRDQAGVLRAFANVCRHRGSRICDKSGHAPVLTCPYHAWTYGLDGSLRFAREMGPDFDNASHGLFPLHLAELGGLIFISFGNDPPSLQPAAAAIGPVAAQYGWAKARVAATRSYSVAANWKLVLENYHECYHCGPAHPEFSHLHALARPGERRIEGTSTEQWDAPEPFRVLHSALSEGAATGSRDGNCVAPPMGGKAGECVFVELGFLTAMLGYTDYTVLYRFIPRGALSTDMDVIWLVDAAARESVDYQEAALTWLWDVTTQADKAIIERNQAGVTSRFYQPGRYGLMEPGARQFIDRYGDELRRML
jgi:Rieske 2Fe-2S family protein